MEEILLAVKWKKVLAGARLILCQQKFSLVECCLSPDSLLVRFQRPNHLAPLYFQIVQWLKAICRNFEGTLLEAVFPPRKSPQSSLLRPRYLLPSYCSVSDKIHWVALSPSCLKPQIRLCLLDHLVLRLFLLFHKSSMTVLMSLGSIASHTPCASINIFIFITRAV